MLAIWFRLLLGTPPNWFDFTWSCLCCVFTGTKLLTGGEVIQMWSMSHESPEEEEQRKSVKFSVGMERDGGKEDATQPGDLDTKTVWDMIWRCKWVVWHFVKTEAGQQLRKSEQSCFHDNFIISQPNPIMWPSLKSSLRDDSNEWSHHRVWLGKKRKLAFWKHSILDLICCPVNHTAPV